MVARVVMVRAARGRAERGGDNRDGHYQHPPDVADLGSVLRLDCCLHFRHFLSAEGTGIGPLVARRMEVVVVVVMVRTAGGRAERGGEDREGDKQPAPKLPHGRR
jgi:hypothetical protein